MTYKVQMPAGVRKYLAYMPTAVRKYFVRLPTICDTANNYVPSPSDFTLWTPSGNVTVTGDVITSPADTPDADRVDFFAGTVAVVVSPFFTVDQAGPKDVSVWVKVESAATGAALKLINSTTADGEWEINVFHSDFNGQAWVLIDANHPAVNVINPMQTAGTALEIYFRGSVNTLTIGLWCMHIKEGS